VLGVRRQGTSQAGRQAFERVNINAPSATSSGFSDTQTTPNGQDVAGSIIGVASNGNVLTGTGVTAGMTVEMGSLPTNGVRPVNAAAT